MGVRSDLEAGFDFEIVDEFLDHYAMMVDAMELLIVDLQKASRYGVSVEELFRIFHNIKSATGFLKLDPMTRLAAYVEDALEQMRVLQGPANEATVTWLLDVHDMFQLWQDDFKMDNPMSKINFRLLKLPDLEAA